LQAGKCSGLTISNPITVNILNYGKYDINSPMYFIKKQIPDLYNKLQGSNAENLGKDFCLHRVGDTLGGIAGPAVAILLIPLIGYREIMWYSVIPGILAMIIFGIFVKEKFSNKNDGVKFFSSVKGLPKDFKKFLVGVGVFGIADFSPTLLILYATTTLAPQFGLLQASALSALFYIIRNIVYAAASFPIGILGDKIGKKKMLVLGYLLATLTFVGFILLPPGILVFVILFSLAGLFIAAVDALEGAIPGTLLKKETKAIGYGVLGTVNGIGDFISSAVVGILWAAFLPSYGFIYAAIFSLVGAIILAKTKLEQKYSDLP
jgi:MFS family permease